MTNIDVATDPSPIARVITVVARDLMQSSSEPGSAPTVNNAAREIAPPIAATSNSHVSSQHHLGGSRQPTTMPPRRIMRVNSPSGPPCSRRSQFAWLGHLRAARPSIASGAR